MLLLMQQVIDRKRQTYAGITASTVRFRTENLYISEIS